MGAQCVCAWAVNQPLLAWLQVLLLLLLHVALRLLLLLRLPGK